MLRGVWSRQSLVLLCVFGLGAGCERRPLSSVPVQSGGDGGAADAGGTSGDATGGSDAGGEPDAAQEAEGGEPEAGEPDAAPACSDDGDDDGVCDDVDNCPSTANPNQADRDEDGKGDACEPECDLTSSNRTSLRSAAFGGEVASAYGGEVASVELNGSGGNVVTVDPGAELVVAFKWGLLPCLPPSGDQHIALGLATDAVDPVCAVESDCTADPVTCSVSAAGVTCPASNEGEIRLTAPTEPGEYYLVAEHDTGSACTGWQSGPPSEAKARIGAVCVRGSE